MNTRSKNTPKRGPSTDINALDTVESKRLKIDMYDHPVAADDRDSDDTGAGAGPVQEPDGVDAPMATDGTGAVDKASGAVSATARAAGTRADGGVVSARSIRRSTQRDSRNNKSSSRHGRCWKKRVIYRAREGGEPAASSASSAAAVPAIDVSAAATAMMEVSAAATAMAAAAEAAGRGAATTQMFAGAERATTVEGKQCAAGVVGGGHGDDDVEVSETPRMSNKLEEFLERQRVVWAQHTEQARRNRATFRAMMGDLAGEAAHFTESYTQDWQREQFVAACGNRRGANAEGLRGAPSGDYGGGAASAAGVGTGTGKGKAGIFLSGGVLADGNGACRRNNSFDTSSTGTTDEDMSDMSPQKAHQPSPSPSPSTNDDPSSGNGDGNNGKGKGKRKLDEDDKEGVADHGSESRVVKRARQ